MDYSLLTEQQLQKRQYNLPDNIREVLGSEKEIETIRQICRNHYLVDNEKILIVEQLVGLVLLGFVPVDNLSREISENIHLNKKHADDIVIEIDRKIFNSIRADLEKVYLPAEALAKEGASFSAEAETEEVGQRPINEARETEQSIPIEIKKPEAPIRIIGMEETTSDQRPMTNSKEPITAEIKSPKIEATEGPMIIHEETEFKPLSETKKSLKPLGGLFGFLSASRRKEEKPEEAKPVRAEISGIDTGNEKLEMKNEEQKEVKPINTKIRTINYTEVPDAQRPTTNDQQQIINNDNKIESPIKIVEEKKEIPKIISSEGISQLNVPRAEGLGMKEQPIIDNQQLMVEKSALESSLAVSPSTELRTGEAEPPVVNEAEPIIIHQETGQKPKKFFSGLSGIFSRKKIEADKPQMEDSLAGESIGNAPEIVEAPAASPLIKDGISGAESPINIVEKEAPKAELEKIKMTDIQLKPELPVKIIDEVNAPQLPVEKNFFRTLVDSSKSLFIEKKKEIHYKEEIKPTTDKR